MINTRNQGSNESSGVKFKEGICAKLWLTLWLESGWYIPNISKSGWFWKRLFRKKVLNNHFLKSLQKQPCADVLQNRCSLKFRNIHRKTSELESLFNKFATLNFIQRRLQHRCFYVNIAKFLRIRTAFFIEHDRSVKDITCRSFLLSQKHNIGWFLLKRFVDLIIVCYLHMISRNLPTRF